MEKLIEELLTTVKESALYETEFNTVASRNAFVNIFMWRLLATVLKESTIERQHISMRRLIHSLNNQNIVHRK